MASSQCQLRYVVYSSNQPLLDETTIVLSPYTDGFVVDPSAWNGIRPGEKRNVRVVKQEGSGLGISIQGGSENNRPIVIRHVDFPANHLSFFLAKSFLGCQRTNRA